MPAVAPALDLGALTAADTTSNTLTDGIRVTCRSFYVPSESRAGTFFFGYQINIVHESQATVKLMERCVCPCMHAGDWAPIAAWAAAGMSCWPGLLTMLRLENEFKG